MIRPPSPEEKNRSGSIPTQAARRIHSNSSSNRHWAAPLAIGRKSVVAQLADVLRAKANDPLSQAD